MSDGTDHGAEAIRNLRKAEQHLSTSDLPTAERLGNLVALVRRFVQMDYDGELTTMKKLFDEFDNL